MSASSAALDHDSHEPANGSWVAEIEEAKDALAEAQEKHGGGGVFNVSLLEMRQRVCRAHSMLRQWEPLLACSKKGLAQCGASNASNNNNNKKSAAAIATLEASFRRYKNQARADCR
jgi:hypothetical protein